jgi:hypothetical protein
MTPDEAISVITTTSPIPSHPSTGIIDATYKSVRIHLPHAKYIFLFDGIRKEQEHLRAGYEEYREIITKRIANGEWANAEYFLFAEWTHQAGMIRAALAHDHIRTPLILWEEHDFPFNGLPIDWQGIVNSLLDDEVCYMRFALPEENWERVRAVHGEAAINRHGVPMVRIMNYSSLPHVARTDFLLRIVKFFKEGKIHLECEATEGIAFQEEQWRLGLYTPPGELARFSSLDGRAGPVKLPMVL